MTAKFLARVRAWFVDETPFDGGREETGAMADDARWGWLPALSGVAVAGDHARRGYAGSPVQRKGMSG